MKFGIFSNNVLKIIACITMLIDHMGVLLFPKITILRIIGRIAFPIFAFLLAEGCYYTRNKIRHLLVISGFAAVMQVVLFLATRMTDFSIFIHFSIAVLLCLVIDLIEKFIKERKVIVSIALVLSFLISVIMLILIDKNTTYFFSNYGLYGIFVPVVLYIIRKYIKHVHLLVSIIVICLSMVLMHFFTVWMYQLYGMIACVFILLYNGKKGKYNLKYLFYIFYPLHLVILYAIALIL